MRLNRWFAFLLVLCLGGVHGSGYAFRRVDVGQSAPDFHLATREGKPVQLSRSLGQRATVVVFWASWNPRSSRALCDVCSIYKENHVRGLQVLSVETGRGGGGEDQLVKLVIQTEDSLIPFPMLKDPNLDVADVYGLTELPAIMILDAHGTIVDLREGYSPTSNQEMRERLSEMGLD